MIDSCISKWRSEKKDIIVELEKLLPTWTHIEEGLPENGTDTFVSVPLLCKYCECTPCYIHSIYNLLVERGEELEEEGCTNRSIRYALYRLASERFHGRLGHGNRQRLPTCVVGDIRDLFPEPGRKYIGFRQKPET